MQIDSNGSLIFYSKTGRGIKNLLLFHGYGQDHSIFDEITQSIGEQYTCYCFDIPFHGRTEWNKGEHPLTKTEWESILTRFFETEKIKDFCLLGFSIGARFALATFEAFPDRTREIFFIAPDGISMRPTIYGIRNCDTIKKARAWLEAEGVDYDFHDYKTAGIDEARLRGWSRELGWDKLLNRAGITFRALPDADKEDLDEDKAVALMLAQPSMIKRPVLDLGDRRMLGFAADRYAEAFAR